MLRGVGFVVVLMLAVGFAVMLYLVIRHFHHKWKWQDKVNEDKLRKSILSEFDIQYEVDDKGFVRPQKRSERGHAPLM